MSPTKGEGTNDLPTNYEWSNKLFMPPTFEETCFTDNLLCKQLTLQTVPLYHIKVHYFYFTISYALCCSTLD